MNEFKINHAKDSDNKPVTASLYNGEKGLTCYECSGSVTYRREHQRKGKSGELQLVRSHFYHSGTSTCRGESVVHLIAKDIVANHSVFDFYHRCTRCHCDYSVLIGARGRVSAQEHRWHDQDGSLFIPDVAYLDDETRKLHSAIEILHTHAIPDSKIDAFNKEAIVWAEVAASHVIERYNAKSLRLSVERSSLIRSGGYCETCHATIEEERIAWKKAEARREENAHLAHIARLKKEEDDKIKRADLEKERVKKVAERLEAEKVERERKKTEELERKRKAVQEKEEERRSNEKTWRVYQDKKKEEEARRQKTTKILVMPESLSVQHMDAEYESRKRSLEAYRDMIMEARKKRRAMLAVKEAEAQAEEGL